MSSHTSSSFKEINSGLKVLQCYSKHLSFISFALPSSEIQTQLTVCLICCRWIGRSAEEDYEDSSPFAPAPSTNHHPPGVPPPPRRGFNTDVFHKRLKDWQHVRKWGGGVFLLFITPVNIFFIDSSVSDKWKEAAHVQTLKPALSSEPKTHFLHCTVFHLPLHPPISCLCFALSGIMGAVGAYCSCCRVKVGQILHRSLVHCSFHSIPFVICLLH